MQRFGLIRFASMGNQSSRPLTYHQYYESLQHSNPHAIQNLDLNNLDPYEVIGVSKHFTFDELKEAYRHIARKVHPDKGGSDRLFQVVTECFRVLAQEYKRRTSDRPHYELKKDAEAFAEKNPSQAHPTFGRDNFLDRFNDMYEKNRLDDEEQTIGYAHMMAASSKTREDISIPRMFDKFKADAFHKTFETVTLPSSKDVVVYREPEALPLARKIQYTELGGEAPNDFTSGEGRERGNLAFTDYMKAHTTTRLVDPRAVQSPPQYKNVEQYEKARAQAMAQPMSQAEELWRKQKEEEQAQAEEQRLARLQKRDLQAQLHHEKVNQLFLGMGQK